MRRSKEDTAKTKVQIVEAASARFRENGICETGLADLMQAAGLTHGGFYRHFGSKDELVAAVTRETFAYTTEVMRASGAEAKKGRGLEAIANDYLAPAHRSDRRNGCPLAALGSELARSGRATRSAATKGMQDMIDAVAAQMENSGSRRSEKAAMTAVATMFGALTMSRIANDPDLSDALLSAARDHLKSLS
jgi:TetR/AcrR family transcriptional repressor of nem operon